MKTSKRMDNFIAVICAVVIVATLVFSLDSCSLRSTTISSPEPLNEEFSPVTSFCNMVILAKDGDSRIWMDKNTGVLYYRFCSGYNGALTAIMKPDGTCLTFDEWKKKVNYKEY